MQFPETAITPTSISVAILTVGSASIFIEPILPDPVVSSRSRYGYPGTCLHEFLQQLHCCNYWFAFPPTLTVPAEPDITGDESPKTNISPPLYQYALQTFTVIFALPDALTKHQIFHLFQPQHFQKIFLNYATGNSALYGFCFADLSILVWPLRLIVDSPL